MNGSRNKTISGGKGKSLKVVGLYLGLALATMMLVAALPISSKAQVPTKSSSVPPGYNPNSPDSIEVPLKTRLVTQGEVSPLSISDTNCIARLDKAHAGRHSYFTKVGGKVGVWKCTYKKKRIWVDVAVQIWKNPGLGYGWYDFKRLNGLNAFNTREFIRYPDRYCSKTQSLYYRLALWNATIVDYDGDRHEMIFRRYGPINQVICAT